MEIYTYCPGSCDGSSMVPDALVLIPSLGTLGTGLPVVVAYCICGHPLRDQAPAVADPALRSYCTHGMSQSRAQ
jgi:hypothetical protein